MIGTIRKHSKWLWIVVATLTIISFVAFMGSAPTKSGGGASVSNGFGTIYGQEVKQQDFLRTQNEFFIFYWAHYGQWPEKAGLSREELERETYVRLLISKKAAKLGVTISEEALVKAASEFLRSVGRNGQAVKMQDFAQQYLAPEGLTVVDLQNFLRNELVVQQLIQTMGMAGALVTPQEAGLLYDRERQEVSAQAVFFAASNYLSQVAVTPAAIAQFYTNNMAAYREPDRVQVSYVFFNVTNYLGQAKADLEKTNFTEYVDAIYQQYGQSQFPEAKTPEEAKAKIRELVIRDRALNDARLAANDFGTGLFAIEPAKPENLNTFAKQKGLMTRITTPFSANVGPEEFSAPAAFATQAFQLNAEAPFAGPIIGPDGVYVIAMANQLPSAIPPLEQIRARVTQDFQSQQSMSLAQRAGTNYFNALTLQMAAGKTFAQAAMAAGQTPLVLSPFSLSSSDLPELGNHATIGQIKQAAFTTTVGHISDFMPTTDGGFVLFVQQMLPLDTTKKNAELPHFMAQVRRARQNEAFNLWLQGEVNRELRDTPFYRNQMAGAAKQP
jgi:hypothetical protein